MSERQRKYDLLNDILIARDRITELAGEPGAVGTEVGQLAHMVADLADKVHDALDAIVTRTWQGPGGE